MKALNKLAIILTMSISAIVLMGWNSSEVKSNINGEQNTIVLLKFKAQADKGDLAVKELINLLEKVKKERHFVSIKLHVDPNDNTNILLYEEWKDISYYNREHMNTEHLKAFMANSMNFLSGPPEITFWKVNNVFN